MRRRERRECQDGSFIDNKSLDNNRHLAGRETDTYHFFSPKTMPCEYRPKRNPTLIFSNPTLIYSGEYLWRMVGAQHP